ncbi:MAG: LysM peptidoglycan-binding domain-containing protein, partial [Flavobacteriales bacterium]|nr:LysM peptidoglycan-binding domain-containing protein [Flavobacteriales bacterium]
AVSTFINNSDSIYAYSESLQEKYVAMDAPIVHRVRKGEYLGKIANQYHTTVGRIKNWNNLSSSSLKIGQKLVIYVNPDSAPKTSQTKPVVNSNGQTIYTVQSGDTLWDIARKYTGVSVSQLERLNNITYRDLKPGLTLKIPKTG